MHQLISVTAYEDDTMKFEVNIYVNPTHIALANLYSHAYQYLLY